MRLRPAVSIGIAATLTVALLPDAASGQGVPWQARTPDLQDVWDFRSLTPLERPEVLAGQEVFSAKEAAQFTEERPPALDKDQPGPDGGIPRAGGYNDFWWDYDRQITGDLRTSFVVDPPNGRVRILAHAACGRAFQTADHVVIPNEMAHGPALRLVEPFTRVAAEALPCEYAVDGPESFERPWSVAVPMRKNDLPVFGYACHEGKYHMLNPMASAWAEDARKAAEGRR